MSDEIQIINQDISPRPNGPEEIIDRFIADQDVRQKSKESYRNGVRQYFDWVLKKGYNIQTITRAEILIYKDELIKMGKSMLTVGAYISTVRRFYEWAESVKLYPNVARGVKVPKVRASFRKEGLTPPQVTQLFDYFRAQGNKRDFAIINLMVRTGLRTIEVQRLRVENILFKSGVRVAMIHGKGKNESDAPVLLTEKTYLPIKEYWETRKDIKDNQPVFLSEAFNNKDFKPVGSKYISGIVKRGLVAIGLDGKQYTAHSLRHTTAISLLRSGATTEAVQGVLRHASADTTAIYTASIKEEMRLLSKTEAMLDDMF